MRHNTTKLVMSIDPAMKARFDRVPWGARSQVMRRLVEWFCDLYDQHGPMAIGAVLADELHLESDAIKKPVPNRDNQVKEH